MTRWEKGMWKGVKKYKSEEKERIWKEILDKFHNKEFTIGDIYYSMFSKYNRSIFGIFYIYIRQFNKRGFLSCKRKMGYSGKKETSFYIIKNAVQSVTIKELIMIS